MGTSRCRWSSLRHQWQTFRERIGSSRLCDGHDVEECRREAWELHWLLLMPQLEGFQRNAMALQTLQRAWHHEVLQQHGRIRKGIQYPIGKRRSHFQRLQRDCSEAGKGSGEWSVRSVRRW